MSQYNKGKDSPFFINRIGEVHQTKEGYITEIIECLSHDNCTIKFNDGTIRQKIRYDQIKKQQITNPNHRSIYGIGYEGQGKYSFKEHVNVKGRWQKMIGRCNDTKESIKCPSYRDKIVCKEWECFQNYAKWFYDNKKEYMHNWHVDKDILKKGNKIYSPETCCFVPQEINSLLSTKEKNKGLYPIGVCRKGKKFQAQCYRGKDKSRNLGTFNTPEEAFQAYKVAKEAYIKELAKKYKHQITEACYQALINWTIEITD